MGLSVRLRKEFGGFKLDVQWSVEDEIAVLFGHSGAGKSMTLRLLAGLMKPDEGSIRLGERILFESSLNIDEPPHRRFLGYVFQDLALFPHMTVRENILYGAKEISHREKEERLDTMTRIFGLNNLGNKLPSQISGGQKQRVAFARALIRRPAALFLDEPFSALDMRTRLDMRGYLREIHRALRIPTVLVTHDAAEARSLADKIIVYSGGRVVHMGTPHEILRRPYGVEEDPSADPDIALSGVF